MKHTFRKFRTGSRISVLALFSSALSLLVAGCTHKEAQTLSYNIDIKPILDQNCIECHKAGGTGAEQSGLVLDSYAGLMQGTRFGPIVIPGQSDSSTLYRLISGQADPSLRMPHDRSPLPREAINKLRTWIDQGAKE